MTIPPVSGSDRPEADAMAAAYAAADAVLARMTLRERIGQMTQPEKGSVTPDEVAEHALGSVLSGGGGAPDVNDAAHWRAMIDAFAGGARRSRLGVPLLYGVDAVHGHNNLHGATIFPHNVALGAVDDVDLTERVARATALETAATGARWTFAPALSLPLDVRWGRTYEGFGQDPDLVGRHGAAVVRGLQHAVEGDRGLRDGGAVLACAKHYLADGGTRYGSSMRVDRDDLDAASEDPTLANAGSHEAFLEEMARGAWTLDQGMAEGSEARLRRVFLAPYRAALGAGALTVMASYGAWNGVRMHAHRSLLQDVLKGELGFTGFVVSDWDGVAQLDPDDARNAVATAVNAGVDMVMVPFAWRAFIDDLAALVEVGEVPEARVTDAARRILAVKARLGLLDGVDAEAPSAGAPAAEPELDVVGCDAHRALAREAAGRSQTLLANDGALLPLAPEDGPFLVAGGAADDVGLQCGGWTISWMGSPGPITPGSTLLEGIRAHAADADVGYERDGGGAHRAPVGIVALAEPPYAEGMGDRRTLALPKDDVALVERVRARVDRLVVIVFSGRPLVLGPVADLADALVAGWLPGSEGAGVADPLFGVRPYEARLRYVWPASDAALPLHPFGPDGEPQPPGPDDPRVAWPLLHGRTTTPRR